MDTKQHGRCEVTKLLCAGLVLTDAQKSTTEYIQSRHEHSLIAHAATKHNRKSGEGGKVSTADNGVDGDWGQLAQKHESMNARRNKIAMNLRRRRP